jgi:hypothetical protein
MKLEQLLIQLFSELPKYTSYFSSPLAIQSLTYSAGVVTATTSTPHNFVVNNTLNITGAAIQNPVISLTRVNSIATAVTQYDHDLTEGYNDTVTISGADQVGYNGEKKLLSVPNRRTFTFLVGNTVITPATGTIFLIEVDRVYNPYNGVKLITSVPTPTTFTYAVSQDVFSPPVGEINLSAGLRIGGALSIEKAIEWYTEQNSNEYWLFVVLDDISASKDRFSLDDAVATTAEGNRYRQRVITPFKCYVIAPLIDDTSILSVSGRYVVDSMRDVFYSLCKSLLRVRIPSGFSESVWSEIMFVNAGMVTYNHAYYVHQFSFEATFDITLPDTVEPSYNVAFRDLEIDFQNITTGDIISMMDINLDDQPL